MGMGLCAHKDIKLIFSWAYSILGICRDLMENVLTQFYYDAWKARVLRLDPIQLVHTE